MKELKPCSPTTVPKGIGWHALKNPTPSLSTSECPGGNGEDVIQSLRQNAQTRHIPIIVLSGAQEYGIKQRALDLGADCFLEKPANFSELMQEVNRLM